MTSCLQRLKWRKRTRCVGGRHTTEIIQDAAKIARDEQCANFPKSEFAISVTLTAIARSVWTNDVIVAKHLIHRTELGKKHLLVVEHTVTLVHPEEFEQMVEEDRKKQSDRKAAGIAADAKLGKNKKRSQMQALQRLAKAWSPFGKRIQLAGVRYREQGEWKVARSAEEKNEALLQGWAPVFAAKQHHRERAQEMLQEFGKKYDFSSASPPDLSDYEEFMSRVAHSQPGKDGVPYIGWHKAGREAAITLFGMGTWQMAGLPVPLELNDGVNVYAPKGEEAGDSEEVVRAATDTRPLTLKNSDNKIVGGTIQLKLKTVLQASANRLQRSRFWESKRAQYTA